LRGMVPDRNIVGKAFAIWMTWPDPKLKNFPSFSRNRLIH
jgi:signal peptidase I